MLFVFRYSLVHLGRMRMLPLLPIKDILHLGQMLIARCKSLWEHSHSRFCGFHVTSYPNQAYVNIKIHKPEPDVFFGTLVVNVQVDENMRS